MRLPDGPDREEVAAFGSSVGLAFQLLDDVLDIAGPPERTGKARGTDLLDGTVTLPLILAADADPGLLDTDLSPWTRPPPRRCATGSQPAGPTRRSARAGWRWRRKPSAVSPAPASTPSSVNC